MTDEVILDLPNAVQTVINACGPATLKPVICALTPHCPRVEDIPWSDKTFTSVDEMIDIGEYYGLELVWKRPITLTWIREQIGKGIPVTLLVRYSVINPPHSFDGNHWITARGFDENRFLINDPLRTESVWISGTTLENAMSQTIGSASTFLAVYPTRGLSMYKPGVNVDPTHHNPFAYPPPALLPGMEYVRFAFRTPRNNQQIDLPAAFALYDPYLAKLDAAGVKPIIVLTHQTYGEGMGYPPWHQMTEAEWLYYFNPFAETCGQIAAHYAGRQYTFQVWNQQDAPVGFEDSVGLNPALYGTLYRLAKQRIKAADPAAKVITGGFLGGAGAVVNYYNAANLSTVAEGIAVHPYGQAPRAYDEFKVHGYIEDYLSVLRSGVTAPIWITEHGILNLPNAPIDKVVRHFSEFAKAVRPFVVALIQYAVVDGMHNGFGILKTNGEPKRDASGNSIFDALAGAVEPPTELQVLRIEGTEVLNLRVSPTGTKIGTITDQTVIRLTGKTETAANAGGYPRVECYTEIKDVWRKCWFASEGSGQPGDDWETKVEVLRVAEVIEL